MKMIEQNEALALTSIDSSRDENSRKNLYRYLLLVTVLYLLISGLGVTTSHLSAISGSTEENSGLLLGSPRPQRSDEFLRGTPRAIASLQGIELENYTPFDYSGTSEYREQQNSLASQLNYYTNPVHTIIVDKISKFLPTEAAFAASWWLNVWLLFISVPVFFYLLGLRISVGFLCAVAVFFSPTNTWFSYLPSALFGQAFGSASLTLIALHLLRGQRSSHKILAILCAFYSGKMAFSVAQYPPWGIPVLILTAIIVISFLSAQHIDRTLVISSLKILLIGSIAALIVIFYNRQVYSITLDTVYPGSRRESGGNGDQILWSGGISWFFQSTFAKVANLANPEVILGPTFLLIPVLFAYFKSKSTDLYLQWFRRAMTGCLALVLILIAWSQFHWPKWALTFNPLVWTPSARADQIVGVMILVPVFMLVNFVPKKSFKWSSVVLVVLFTIGIASRDMQSTLGKFLPGAGIEILMISILMVCVMTICYVGFTSPFPRVAPLILFLISSSVLVNPVVRGIGALGSSDAVSTMKELSETAPDGRWATTGFYQDALMISTGVPQLSGQQPFGPSKDFWRKLDTQNKFENNWNRGQAYINFAWDPREDLVIWNPSGDVIQIVTSPCRPNLQDLGLRWVTSPIPLDYSCLVERAEVQWMEAPMYIYEVRTSN
jgi:hypothetical protein